jgi:hypothetical protein
MSVHAVEPNPQFLSTNRHVMQGYVDLAARPAWDAARGALAGASKVVGGETYKVILAANGRRVQGAEAAGAQAKVRVADETNGLLELSLDANSSREVAWTVTFDRR